MKTRSQWLVAGALLLSLTAIATAQIVQRPLTPGNRKSAGISYWTAASEPAIASDGELAVRSNGVGTRSDLVLFDSANGGGWQVITMATAAGGTNNTIPVWDSIGQLEDSAITDTSGVVVLTGTLEVTSTTTQTGDLTTLAQINIADGTAADPSISFTSDDDGSGTGFHLISAGTLGFTTGGATRMQLTSAALTILDELRIPDGSAANPIIAFTSEVTTGISLAGAANLAFSVTGALVFDLEDTNAAGASANLATISATLGIFNGSDTFNGLSIELTNVNHTSTGNTVNLISLAAIAGDAESNLNGILIGALTGTTGSDSEVETALNISSGWDNGILLAPPTNGGNLDEQNQFQGLIRMAKVSLGTMTDGTGAATEVLIDSDPTGEWSEADAEVTLDADTGIARKGSNSLGIAWTSSALDGDGAIHALGANEDWESLESVGMWWRCAEAATAGWLELSVEDDGGDQKFGFPANTTVDVWEWIEIDITALDAGTGDVVANLGLEISGTGAGNALDCNFDLGYVWDAADEEALGVDILVDGVVYVEQIVTATGGNRTPIMLVQDTGYFIHYQSGNDFLVSLADNQTFSGTALVLHQ